ncbi:rhomboid family intramembrane serine protease [Rasiella rasia]|uniref:Rhomboid family intramembrane serine protease n=2 Tax=Rasiella rasia TaxID=2744027 RepID=A0A6G6GIE9_9FLAO|nr:rhomboid family intramembrane serine protease [Rasiella rasia]
MNTNNLSYQFKTANVVIKLIVVNLLIFLVVRLTAFFMQIAPKSLVAWFMLPDAISEVIVQPWAFLTYSFLHFGFWHLLFNMLWLYYFGNYVLNLFTGKRLLTIYLLGAIFGGLLYVVSYNLFPVFENSRSDLIGASGSVTAIIVFIATYTPNAEMRLFKWNIKLWHIAVFLVLMDLIRLPVAGNEGGMLAHLGGALFGYVYAKQLAKGNDIGKWFEATIDWFTNLFKTRKQKPFKKVHRTTTTASSRSSSKSPVTANQKKIDAILDKIGKSGYDSLTKAEKDFLFKAGKE